MSRFATSNQVTLSKKTTQIQALLKNAIPAVKQVVEQVADEIIVDLISNYDSAVPGDSYVRTGDLGEGWIPTKAIEQSNGSIVVTISNHVVERGGRHREYAAFVQGDRRTSRHEQAGWLTIFEVQQFYSTRQGNLVRSAIKRAGNL